MVDTVAERLQFAIIVQSSTGLNEAVFTSKAVRINDKVTLEARMIPLLRQMGDHDVEGRRERFEALAREPHGV